MPSAFGCDFELPRKPKLAQLVGADLGDEGTGERSLFIPLDLIHIALEQGHSTSNVIWILPGGPLEHRDPVGRILGSQLLDPSRPLCQFVDGGSDFLIAPAVADHGPQPKVDALGLLGDRECVERPDLLRGRIERDWSIGELECADRRGGREPVAHVELHAECRRPFRQRGSIQGVDGDEGAMRKIHDRVVIANREHPPNKPALRRVRFLIFERRPKVSQKTIQWIGSRLAVAVRENRLFDSRPDQLQIHLVGTDGRGQIPKTADRLIGWKDCFGNGDRRLASFEAIGAGLDRVVLDPNLQPVSPRQRG